MKSDTEEEAKEIFDIGYQIYGWDSEWHIKKWDFKNESVKSVQNKVNNKTMDFSNDEDAHPYYDMYSKENISKDRLKDSWEAVRDDLLEMVYYGHWFDSVGKTNGKVILLMHERAFRNGKLINGKVDLSNTNELDKLRELIDYFQNIKAEFKTLDKY